MMDQISKDDWIVDDSSLLTTSHVLGHGKFGLVTLMGDSQLRCYAKKTYSLKYFYILQKELNIMLQFHNHPNIIGAKSSVVHFSNDNQKKERVCYIYMEYANKRTLRKMISEEFHGKSLPEYMIQRVARMILQGLKALHAKGYVHCDLNPCNILICHSNTHEEPFDLKIAGFGFSKEPNSLGGSKLVSLIKYRSPESCCKDEPNHPADDIWSLGSIVFEMFGARPMKDLFDDYYDWLLAEDISLVAREFLWLCRTNQANRATATELLNHPFITQKLSPPPSPPLPTITRQVDYTMIPKLPGSIW